MNDRRSPHKTAVQNGTGLIGMLLGFGHHHAVTRVVEVDGGLDVTLDQAARGPHVFIPEGGEAEELRRAWAHGGHVWAEFS